MYRKSLICFVGFILLVSGHHDGAPKDACDDHGTPSHGDHKTQPIDTNPYSVIASSLNYSPGSEVNVTVSGEVFMGFYFEALDKATDKPVGNWIHNEVSHPITECSAVTHNEHGNKTVAYMTWRADNTDKSGELVIRGTVVQTYETFWVGIIATTN